MRDGSAWTKSSEMNREDLLKISEDRINSIDFKNAAKDVSVFIKNPAEVAGWSKELFLSAIKNIKTD